MITIRVSGKAKSGKSTIMEIIHDALKQHFYVKSIPFCGETFPPSSCLSKRIDTLKKKEIKIAILEIQANK